MASRKPVKHPSPWERGVMVEHHETYRDLVLRTITFPGGMNVYVEAPTGERMLSGGGPFETLEEAKELVDQYSEQLCRMAEDYAARLKET